MPSASLPWLMIDETATSINMVRLRGRCPRGERLIGHVPQGEWKPITFVAALRHNKMEAPMVLDGPINGASFVDYIEQCLAPTLKRGDIVVIDNQSPPSLHERCGKCRARTSGFKLQRVANVPEHPPPSSRVMSCAHIAKRLLPRIIEARRPDTIPRHKSGKARIAYAAGRLVV
jgi:DDE superfamily endonuclease